MTGSLVVRPAAPRHPPVHVTGSSESRIVVMSHGKLAKTKDIVINLGVLQEAKGN